MARVIRLSTLSYACQCDVCVRHGQMWTRPRYDKLPTFRGETEQRRHCGNGGSSCTMDERRCRHDIMMNTMRHSLRRWNYVFIGKHVASCAMHVIRVGIQEYASPYKSALQQTCVVTNSLRSRRVWLLQLLRYIGALMITRTCCLTS